MLIVFNSMSHQPEEAIESLFLATDFLLFVSFFSTVTFSSLPSADFSDMELLLCSLLGLDEAIDWDDVLPLVLGEELIGGGALLVATTGELVVFNGSCKVVFCLG